MYRWSSADGLAAALARAGWHDIEVDTVDFDPKLYSPDDMSEVITTPATRVALATLSDEQIRALVAYLERRGRQLFGGQMVPLPRQAWQARGVA
jgi:hypothetical protein